MRELSTKYELAEKVMGRVTNRIQALKKHAKTEHVRLRSELALYGLFEDADISHDKHLNPEDLAFHIHERVDNLLLHAKEVWLEDAKADNNGSVVHDAASSLVPSFSVQLCKTQPIFYEVRRINKVNLMISVFEGEDPPHFDFEAYHPPTCGTFKVSCSLRQQRELLRRTPELVEDESRFEDRVEALIVQACHYIYSRGAWKSRYWILSVRQTPCRPGNVGRRGLPFLFRNQMLKQSLPD